MAKPYSHICFAHVIFSMVKKYIMNNLMISYVRKMSLAGLVVVMVMIVHNAHAQDTMMYRGGYYDGYSSLSQTNFTPSALTHFSAYMGGAGDGYADILLQQYTPSTLNGQSMYIGGDGDGYAQYTLQQFTPSPLNGQSMYIGGNGDGYTSISQQNFTPDMLTQYYAYMGNSGDGYASLQQSQFMPGYLTHFTPYAGGQGDGYAGTLIIGVVLPIKLVSFEGEITDNGNLLEWKVSMEKDLKSYGLQRSATGNHFQTIYTKDITANSETKKTYHYLDTEPLEGTNYYRLQINNLSEKTEYSNIVLLVYKKGGQSITVFPNPAQDMLTLQYKLNGKAMMRITDMKGSIITQQQLDDTQTTIQIPVSHLAQGMYMLQVTTGNDFNQSIRFIKQ